MEYLCEECDEPCVLTVADEENVPPRTCPWAESFKPDWKPKQEPWVPLKDKPAFAKPIADALKTIGEG